MKKYMLFALVPFLFGCATAKGLFDPQFKPGSLQSITVLSVTAPNLFPVDVVSNSEKITTQIKLVNPETKVIGYSESMQKLSTNQDVLKMFSELMNTYTNTGIWNGSIITEIATFLEVDGFFVGTGSSTQSDGVYGGNAGTTTFTLQYFLLSGVTGKQIWSATSPGKVETITTLEPAPPVSKAFDDAVTKLLKVLPKLHY